MHNIITNGRAVKLVRVVGELILAFANFLGELISAFANFLGELISAFANFPGDLVANFGFKLISALN